jgi:hypothetical protein
VTGARVYSVDGYSDFPQLNSKLIGREAQFGYFLYYDPATTDPTGIVQAHITSDIVYYTVACTTVVHKHNHYVCVWSHECPKTRDIFSACLRLLCSALCYWKCVFIVRMYPDPCATAVHAC